MWAVAKSVISGLATIAVTRNDGRPTHRRLDETDQEPRSSPDRARGESVPAARGLIRL
jgi:hypothetical protein